MTHICRLVSSIAIAVAALVMSAGLSAQKTYLVCVGLGNYDNNEKPLPCSKGDATSIARFFKNYNNSEVFMLLDANATRDHILRVLKNQFSKSGPKDEIIFAYSGHGFDGGISCYDTKNAIWCTEIQDIMRSCKARRKVMFINSCHSGSFSKKKNDGKTRRNFRSNKSDVMLFMSSRANELSWETGAMDNSFFFSRLLEALRGAADRNGDNRVTARELFNYVSAGVQEDMNGTQHPQMFGNFPDDMVVVYCQD